MTRYDQYDRGVRENARGESVSIIIINLSCLLREAIAIVPATCGKCTNFAEDV